MRVLNRNELNHVTGGNVFNVNIQNGYTQNGRTGEAAGGNTNIGPNPFSVVKTTDGTTVITL